MCWLWGFQQFGGLDNFCKSKSKSKNNGNGKGKGKGQGNDKGKGKRREASLRQSGSAFGAAIVGRAEALPFRFVKICFRFASSTQTNNFERLVFRFVKICFRFARVLPFGKLRARSCL
jgi:hypothetical protein